MANKASAKKRVRTSARKQVYNRPFRAAPRTYVKAARTAIADGSPEAVEAVKAAIVALDKSVQKGVVHRNNAARRKSRLMKLLNAASKPAEA